MLLLLCVVLATMVALSACGSRQDVGSASAAATACWDPGFGVYGCMQDEWWIEFSATDTTTTAMQLEVSSADGGPSQIIDLPNLVQDGAEIKFSGGPDNSPITAGTLVRLKATKGTQSATSVWFPYLTGAPTLDCPDASAGADAGSMQDATSDQTAALDTGAIDVTGCSSSWNPTWQQTTSTSIWWAEYVVTSNKTPVSVELDVVNGAAYPLAYAWGKWSGGLGGVASGTLVVLHAVAADSTTTQTLPFHYLVDQTPTTGCSNGVADSGAYDATLESGAPESGAPESGSLDSGQGGCVAPWDPFWTQTQNAGSWWAEFIIVGGGSLPVSATLEIVGGTSYSLSSSYGKWWAGLNGVSSGTTVILHATDATGATAHTKPFQYLVDTSATTDACKGTPSTSPSCVPLKRGMLTISMDDSHDTQNTIAGPVLTKYGVKATIYNITQNLSVYGDLPNAQALASAGNETGSHTVTHPYLTQLTPQQLDDELRLSQQYLLANVGSPVVSFASPMGDYNATVIAAIKKYYTSHRTVNPGMNYMGNRVWELNADGVGNINSPANVCAWIQDAAKYRGWRILFWHDFTSATTSNTLDSYPVADFDAILKCATTTPGLDIVTTAKGADAIRCASPP